MTMRIVTIILAAALAASCRSANYRKSEEMMPLASRLTKVTMAVEAAVQNDPAAGGLSDAKLIRLATAHDRSLVRPFSKLKLRAEGRGGHAVVLLCSKDGKTALFEDSGCTASMEKHHWQAAQPVPCELTIPAEDVCPKN